jgi:hypothetical protein
MPEADRNYEDAIRVRAYFIWEHEGRPNGRAHDHWHSAALEVLSVEPDEDAEFIDEAEKVLAGRQDANVPALLTKDVRGG